MCVCWDVERVRGLKKWRSGRGEGDLKRAWMHMHQPLCTFCPQYYVIKITGTEGYKQKVKRKEGKAEEWGKKS